MADFALRLEVAQKNGRSKNIAHIHLGLHAAHQTMLRINQNSDDAFLIEIPKKFVKREIKIALRRHSHQVAVQAINNYRRVSFVPPRSMV